MSGSRPVPPSLSKAVEKGDGKGEECLENLLDEIYSKNILEEIYYKNILEETYSKTA